MSDDNRWSKLEEVVRRVLREELAASKARKKSEAKQQWTGVFDSEQLQTWRDAYPTVDVEAEIKKMTAWVTANPQTAPKSQFSRFANTWLERCHNRASIRSIPFETKTDPKAITPSLCEYCLRPSVGAVNGIRHCRDHFYDASDRKPRSKMPGVVAKAVAGAD